MEIPTIETLRLRLRALTPSDFEPLCAIVSDRAVIRYFPRTEPWPKEIVQRIIEQQKSHWDKHGFGWYAAECLECNELLGWCGLGVLDETGETEIKYLLKQSHWGKGLATEGASRCLRDGFRDYGLEMAIGLVHPENVASQNSAPFLQDDEGRYYAAMCINLDVSLLSVIQSALAAIIPPYDDEISEAFGRDLEDLLSQMILRAATATGTPLSEMKSADRLQLIANLEPDVFQWRNAVPTIAQFMGVSRSTVYNYLKELKSSA